MNSCTNPCLEDIFSRELPQIREFVKQNIDQIDEVVYHYRQIAQHTREQQNLDLQRSFRVTAFGSKAQNPYDRAAFPVDNLPAIRTRNFFGREMVMERIDHHLGNQREARLRTYLIYGLRGVGYVSG